jgi:hypothetical protein
MDRGEVPTPTGSAAVMEPHDLYGLPLEQFTQRRNALAAELRRNGRRDQAAAVSKLRKPSVAAWAVNQLVRTQRGDLNTLFRAGDALAQAQADLLKKRGDAGALREAVESERRAVEVLTDRARGLLNTDGHELTQARLEQVSETLHAAALDEDARTQVRDGCLDRELRHVGLGGPVKGAGRSLPRRAQRNEERGSNRDADRRAEAAARRQLEKATRDLGMAEEQRKRAARELRAADDALRDARKRVAEAEREHERARRKLERT